MKYHTDNSRHAHHDRRGNDPFLPVVEDGNSQFGSEFVEATRPDFTGMQEQVDSEVARTIGAVLAKATKKCGRYATEQREGVLIHGFRAVLEMAVRRRMAHARLLEFHGIEHEVPEIFAEPEINQGEWA